MRRIVHPFSIVTLALGCGGGTFTFEDPDAGRDASSTSGGSGTSTSGTTSATTGDTTSGSTTSGSGSSGTGSATGGSAGTGGGTTGGGGASGGSGGKAGSTGAGGVATGGAGGAGSGGHGGNAGNGGSGGDAGIDWSQCGGPGQCSAQLTGCCAPCVTPMLDRFAGVNPMYTDAFRAFTCPVPTPCPRCAVAPNPYIGARCVSSHCQAFDTRQEPAYSKCTVDVDCRLRKGLDCCECGSQGEWTAVSIAGQAALGVVLCAPMTGCADCLPVPPDNMKAVCVQSHCEVSQISP